jgi:hypothetical protein
MVHFGCFIEAIIALALFLYLPFYLLLNHFVDIIQFLKKLLIESQHLLIVLRCLLNLCFQLLIPLLFFPYFFDKPQLFLFLWILCLLLFSLLLEYILQERA